MTCSFHIRYLHLYSDIISFRFLPYRKPRWSVIQVSDIVHNNKASWSIITKKETYSSEGKFGDGAVVRALASHQCGPGSIPGPGAIRELRLLLVLDLAPRVFSPGPPVFSPSSQKKMVYPFSFTLVKQSRFLYFIFILTRMEGLS